MGPVWALLLLFPITQGAEHFCDARKDHTQCYGALGGIMKIQFMDNGSTTERFTWTKNRTVKFRWKNYKLEENKIANRSDFFENTGVFQLRNLSKDDSDSYTLEFHEKGIKIGYPLTHELVIQDKVSSVHLKDQCLSNGEMKVTCTAERGDSPEFSWTLDEQNLTDAQLFPQNEEKNTIILEQNTKGRLCCYVRNNVSEAHKELNIPTCGYIQNCTSNWTQISNENYEAYNTLCIKQPPTTFAPNTSVGKTSTLTPSNQTYPSPTARPLYRDWPIMVGALAAVLIIGIAVGILVCVLKKKCNKNEDEEHELTYADVRILQHPARRAQPQASETVEYGQVRFSNLNRHTPEAADNAIYAKVRK